jgi:hypothetical protein
MQAGPSLSSVHSTTKIHLIMPDPTSTTEILEVTPAMMDDVFGGFGASSPPPSPFTRKNEFALLEDALKPEEEEEEEVEEEGEESEETLVDKILGTPKKKTKPATQAVQEEPETGFLAKLVTKGVLLPFDGEKKIEEYDDKEVEELILANIEDARTLAREEALADLPEEVSYVIDYVKNGGTDITGVFSMLGTVREHRELDAENPDHHEAIVRSYMMLKNEEDSVIENDIAALKDRKGAMEAKAKLVKPLLDKAMKEETEAFAKEQKDHNARVQENRTKFIASVKAAVEKGEINGIKLDAKLKTTLVEGMTAMTHKSVTGRPTNLMGKLLEEYTGAKPNLPLVMEALFLLSDPEGYRSRIRQSGATTEAEKTRKLLKQAEAEKGAPGTDAGEIVDSSNRKRLLPPPPKSILDTLNRKK